MEQSTVRRNQVSLPSDMSKSKVLRGEEEQPHIALVTGFTCMKRSQPEGMGLMHLSFIMRATGCPYYFFQRLCKMLASAN